MKIHFALRMLVSAALAVGSVVSTAQPTRAAFTGNSVAFLSWAQAADVVPTRSFGVPGEPITIGWGLVNSLSNNLVPGVCPPNGINDGESAFANVYVVEHGSVKPGDSLVGKDVSGAPNIIGGPGGYFFNETVGAVGGKIVSGRDYDIVFDECQDDVFGPEDEIFPSAFAVKLDPSATPSLAMSAIKISARQQATYLQTQGVTLGVLFTLLDTAAVLATVVNPNISTTLDILIFGIQAAAPVAPSAVIIQNLLTESRHWQAIASDPPDPDFRQVTPLGRRPPVDAQSPDPILIAVGQVGTAVGTEDAIAEAMLHEIERYQGAAAAGDGTWALIHARTLQQYARLLASQRSQTSATFSALATAVAADPRPLDAAATQLENLRSQIASAGFSTDQVTYLRNLGFTDAQLTDVRATLANDSLSFTRTGFQSTLAAQLANDPSLVSALTGLATSLDPVVQSLSTNPLVADQAPTASAGGPYTATAATAITLNGAASTTPAGTGTLTYAWDLTGSGTFQDSSGPTPSFTFDRPFSGLIGLRVTNAAGYSSLAYAPLTVTTANQPPVFNAFSPNPRIAQVDVGTPATFSVTTSDPNGDAVSTQWLLDGTPAAAGPTFTYNATVAGGGVHSLEAVATDANPASATVRLRWIVGVVGVIPASWNTTSNTVIGTGLIQPGSAVRLNDGRVLAMDGGGNQSEVFDPGTGTWSPTNNSPVVSRTLTLLSDGRVLATSTNRDPFTFSASADVYDPTTNTWSPTGSMLVGRIGQTATLLQDGRVLVAGGFAGDPTNLSEAELWTPATNAWTATGKLLLAREAHSATLLPNGKVLVAGGEDAAPTESELYDPASGSWSRTGDLSTGRLAHMAALLATGKVLISGGANGNNLFWASAELYDPVVGTWSSAGSMSTARFAGTLTPLQDGSVLAAGGEGCGTPNPCDNNTAQAPNLASAELYDPFNNVWTTTARLATARAFQLAALLASGQVLAIGGVTFNPATGVTSRTASVEIFTPPSLRPNPAAGGGPALAPVTSAVGIQTKLSVASASGAFGGTTSLSATLTANGSPLPNRTIQFTLNGTAFAGNTASTNASGSATVTSASLAGLRSGTYADGVGASYAGESGFLASTDSGVLAVGPAATSLSADSATATFGDASVSIPVRVIATGAGGGAVNEGSVTPALFQAGHGAGQPASAHVANGVAAGSVGLTGVLAGSYILATSYRDDASPANFGSSGSSAATLTIAPHATTTSLAAPPSAGDGAQISLKASVSPATLNGQTLSGSVTFALDGVALGSTPIDSTGAATFLFTLNQPAGPHSLTATFSSTNPNFARSSAAAETLQVIVADTSAPVVSPTEAPPPNAAGWNSSPVTVSWSVSDPDSGIASSTGCESTTVSTQTAGTTVTCQATNGAGLSTSRSVTVKLDTAPPTSTATLGAGPLPPGATLLSVTAKATVLSTTGAVLGTIQPISCWNTAGLVVGLNASDPLSGVQKLSYSANGAQPIPSTTATASTLPVKLAPGAPGLTTLVYGATDTAGNAEAAHSLSVVVGHASDDGAAFACAAPTPTFTLPPHGSLALSATLSFNGKSVSFSKTVKF